MKTRNILSATGYAWAFLCLMIIPVMFIGNDFFSGLLAKAPFMKVHPRFSGGDVIKTIEHASYRTHVHRPVFDALIGESASGFIQISWEPLKGIPAVIDEEIDYDGDGKTDFQIHLDTDSGKSSLRSSSPSVVSLDLTCKIEDGWVVRVNLKQALK